jgi:hypothetical protein
MASHPNPREPIPVPEARDPHPGVDQRVMVDETVVVDEVVMTEGVTVVNEVGVVVDEGMPVRVPDDMPMVDDDAPLKCPGSAVACPCWSP